MKNLVLGGTGTVGSALLKELRERGTSVRAMVRKKNGEVLQDNA